MPEVPEQDSKVEVKLLWLRLNPTYPGEDERKSDTEYRELAARSLAEHLVGGWRIEAVEAERDSSGSILGWECILTRYPGDQLYDKLSGGKRRPVGGQGFLGGL